MQVGPAEAAYEYGNRARHGRMAKRGGGRGNRTPDTLSGVRISNPLHYRSAIPPDRSAVRRAGDPVGTA